MASSPVTTQRIPSLDGLRAISIVLVIVGHCAGSSDAAYTVAAFGVQVFFVISGYLITTLLQQEKDRTGRISLSAFYLRRAFRILPAAFAFLIVVAIAFPIVRPYLVYAFTYSICYLHSAPAVITHLWSLSVEEQFYLIWPLALVLCWHRRGSIAIGAMIVAAGFRLCAATWGAPQFQPQYLHPYFPGVMDSIAAGCLLAIHGRNVARLDRWLASSTAWTVLPLTSLAIGLYLWHGTWTSPAPHATLTLLWGIVPMLIALWIRSSILRKDWILNNRGAGAVGVLSYSLYLWQQPFTHPPVTYPIARALMLAAVVLASYFCIERPAITLGKRLAGFTRPPRPVLRIEEASA
jgi:peptidoglycan/LPS O-acetylase OafA/YrhL